MKRIGEFGRRWRPTALPLAFLLLAALIYHFPRLFLDLFYFNYDTQIHFLSSLDFIQALREGQLLPRWLDKGSQGLGAPVFVMYSPFFFYLVGLANIFTGDVWLAIKIVNLLSSWLTGVVAYFIFRRLRMPQFGLLAGLCLQFAPAFVVYLFTTMFTHTNLLFALLFVYGYLVYDPRRQFIDLRATVITFFMIFTHVISAVTILFSFFVGAAIAGLIQRRDIAAEAKRVFGFGLSCLLAVGLAALHILPGVFSQDFVDPRHFRTDIGLSMLLPFQADMADIRWVTAQWTVPLILLAINLATTVAVINMRGQASERFRFAVLCLACAWVALLIGSPLSLPLWEVFAPLATLQFGHRFNFALTMFALLASIAALAAYQMERGWSWFGRALALPGIVSCAAGAVLLTKYSFVDAEPSPFLFSQGYTVDGPPDFRPATAKPERHEYLARGGFAAECETLGLVCETTREYLHDRRWTIEAERPTQLRLPVLHFPGWAVSIENDRMPILADPETGLVSVRVPAGRSFVRLYWSYAGYERAGIAISLVALALILLIFGVRRMAAGPKDTVAPSQPSI